MPPPGSERPTEPIPPVAAEPTRRIPSQTPSGARSATPPPSPAPRRAEGVELVGEYEGSGFKNPRFVVRRPDGSVLQVTDLVYLVLEEMDGAATVEDIAGRVSERYGRRVSAGNVASLIDGPIRRDGLLQGAPTRASERPDPLLGLRLRVTLVPEPVVNFLAGMLRPFFWPPVMVGALAGLVALDVWLFGSHGIAPSIRSMLMEPHIMLLVYGLMILSVGWHELGHATACRYGGARPGRIGFGIYIVWPAFYTDVTDIYRLGKWGRVRTDVGGMYFNVLFALGVAAVYAATSFEPLLILILIQHLLVLFQLMPFLRMDGYHVISDITGVPDLFARIRPTLASLAPWRETPREVSELKPWARAVVTVWVVLAIPLLLYLFSMMILAAPRMIATASDSLGRHWDTMTAALRTGDSLRAAADGFRSVMLVLPATGMTVTLLRAGRRVVAGAFDVTAGRPIARALAVVVGALAVAGGAFVLWPNGDYRPIGPNERWTAGEGLHALAEAGSGKTTLGREPDDSIEPGVGDPGEDEEPDPEDTVAGPSESPSPYESIEEPSPTPSESVVSETPTETP